MYMKIYLVQRRTQGVQKGTQEPGGPMADKQEGNILLNVKKSLNDHSTISRAEIYLQMIYQQSLPWSSNEHLSASHWTFSDPS